MHLKENGLGKRLWDHVGIRARASQECVPFMASFMNESVSLETIPNLLALDYRGGLGFIVEEVLAPLGVLLAHQTDQMQKGRKMWALWSVAQFHPGFLGGSVAFLPIAGSTGGHDIFPGVCTPT